MAKLDTDDLNAIKNLVEVAVDEAIEKKELVTKKDISHLPTKDEFYSKMDKVMGELKSIRESQEIITSKVYENHESRITKIESQLRATAD